MKPAPFRYADPGTLQEVLTVLSVEGEGAKVLAGGQSLLPLLSMRLAAPTTLVDINRVPGLDAVEVTSGAFLDNPASLGVSRKVGYRHTDTSRVVREGRLALHAQLRLRPDDLVRGEAVEVTGVEPLRAFLGVAQPAGAA